jgi:ATP-dependent exoDNAse (exonuclease V) beta subunit
LKEAGYIDFSRVPAGILEHAQERGTLVHQALHYAADGDLVLDSVREDLRGYVYAGLAFRQAAQLTVYGAECRVWSRTWRLAGTVDLIGRWHDDRLCVADYKTGNPADVAADLQLAAYAELLRETFPEFADEEVLRVSVRLTRDGAFHVEPYDDDHSTDWSIFLAALTTVTERRRRQNRRWE